MILVVGRIRFAQLLWFSGLLVLIFFAAGRPTHAQSIPPTSYLFVEVRDPAGKPVTDATIKVSTPDGQPIEGVWSGEPVDLKTDQSGVVNAKFRATPSHHYDLRVAKAGYLSAEEVLFTRFPNAQIDLVGEFPQTNKILTRPFLIHLVPIPSKNPSDALALAKQSHQLFLAAKRGDAIEVRKLLHEGVDPNVTDQNGVAAITWAAFAGDTDTIKELLAAGAKIRTDNSFGRQTLLIYLREGLGRAPFLRAGKDLSIEEIVAVLRSHRDIVLGLIKAGATVNATNSYEGTVLNNALGRLWPSGSFVESSISFELIKVLVALGVDVNASDYSGETPLMAAVMNGSFEAIKLLLDSGAKTSINARNNYEDTALIYAASRGLGEAVPALIDAGARVNIANKFGFTPLMMAIEHYYLPLVRYLLAHGAKTSINARDKDGRTALFHAVIPSGSGGWSNAELIKVLIAAGADVNIKDNHGNSPLFVAKERNDRSAIALLQNAGARE